VTGEWTKFHEEGLHNLYPFCIIRMIKSRRMRRAVHVAQTGETRNACKFVVGKSQEKRPLWKPR
jgi:hypothetical protein